MRQRRGCIFTVLGIVLAVVTASMIFFLLQQAAPTAAQVAPPPTPIPTKPVPVAARDLAVGEKLTEADITQQDQPENLMPVGVFTDTAQIVDQVVVEPVRQGEFLRPDQLSDGSDAPLSAQIDTDKVAMAFSMEDLLNKSKVLREGDHVDLLLTLDIKQETPEFTREGKSTAVTLQNIEVLRIERDEATEQNPDPEVKGILFQMNPQDAVIAKFVKDAGGTVDFVLRSRLNDTTFETHSINQDYMFDHYGFQVPLSSTKPKQ